MKPKVLFISALIGCISILVPQASQSAEVRMGKGKGNPEGWAAIVQPGRILFEADGVSMQVAKEAFELAAQKLPILTKFVVRHDYTA